MRSRLPSVAGHRMLIAAVVCLLLAAGYLWLRQDGLDDISSRPCGGIIEKRTLISVLPDTREVETGGTTHASTKVNYRQSCFFEVDGSQASVYIVVRSGIEDFKHEYRSEKKWKDSGRSYERLGGGFIYRGSPGISDVIAPCPASQQENNALSSSVETRGELRVEGSKLQELLKELALQSLRRVHEQLDCSRGS